MVNIGGHPFPVLVSCAETVLPHGTLARIRHGGDQKGLPSEL